MSLDSELTVPEPGDTLEIAFVAGDPQLLYIPNLTARADVAADTVSGEASAGADVRVRVESAQGTPEVVAQADGSGAYQAQLGGAVDLQRPANGTVSVTDSGGVEFFTTWAAVQLTVSLGNSFSGSFVAGNGPTWRTVRAQLFTPEGQLAGEGRSLVFGGNVIIVGGSGVLMPQFFLTPTDIAGAPVEIRPGDKLRITAGDDVFELVLPPLDAVIFVQTDTVNGHSLPDSEVLVQIASGVTGGISAEATAMTDAGGNFSHSFAGSWDIQYGDVVQLMVNAEGHLVLNTTIAPGLHSAIGPVAATRLAGPQRQRRPGVAPGREHPRASPGPRPTPAAPSPRCSRTTTASRSCCKRGMSSPCCRRQMGWIP